MKDCFVFGALMGIVAGALLIKNYKPAEQLVEKGQNMVKDELKKVIKVNKDK